VFSLYNSLGTEGSQGSAFALVALGPQAKGQQVGVLDQWHMLYKFRSWKSFGRVSNGKR
jgi:hypothetical protein